VRYSTTTFINVKNIVYILVKGEMTLLKQQKPQKGDITQQHIDTKAELS